MQSTIVEHLKPEFEPVAVVWSETIPNDALEVMRRRFRDDTLTLTIPMPLYLHLEREATNSVLQIPAWSELRSGARKGSGGPKE